MSRRRQHVYFVQSNDEIVIHFTSEKWKPTTMALTCTNGVVSITVEQDDVVVTSQLAQLTTHSDYL